MPYTAYIVHHSPGRMRLRIPEAKGRRVVFERARQAISPIRGVCEVETNLRTGSVLVHYEPDDLEDIIVSLQESAEFAKAFSVFEPELENVQELEEAGAKLLEIDSHATDRLTDFLAQVDGSIKRATHNELDLTFLGPAAVALLGFFGSRKRIGTPLWVSLSTFAINSFISLHEARERRHFGRKVLERVTE